MIELRSLDMTHLSQSRARYHGGRFSWPWRQQVVTQLQQGRLSAIGDADQPVDIDDVSCRQNSFGGHALTSVIGGFWHCRRFLQKNTESDDATGY
jgi:hypothetical protein